MKNLRQVLEGSLGEMIRPFLVHDDMHASADRWNGARLYGACAELLYLPYGKSLRTNLSSLPTNRSRSTHMAKFLGMTHSSAKYGITGSVLIVSDTASVQKVVEERIHSCRWAWVRWGETVTNDWVWYVMFDTSVTSGCGVGLCWSSCLSCGVCCIVGEIGGMVSSRWIVPWILFFVWDCRAEAISVNDESLMQACFFADACTKSRYLVQTVAVMVPEGLKVFADKHKTLEGYQEWDHRDTRSSTAETGGAGSSGKRKKTSPRRPSGDHKKTSTFARKTRRRTLRFRSQPEDDEGLGDSLFFVRRSCRLARTLGR